MVALRRSVDIALESRRRERRITRGGDAWGHGRPVRACIIDPRRI